MKVTLIRHTRPDVEKGTCYGWTDVPLAASFVEEATRTRHNLEQLPTVEKAFSSPLTRALRLAEFCGFSHPQVDNRLKEMNMGDWEMQHFERISDPYIQEWFNDYLHLPTPNGESFPMLYRRVASFLDDLRAQSFAHVAIFAHGGVLVCAGIYAGLWTEEHAFEHQTDYGGILEIEI